jgi:prepilin-type N-terminal cleavage/methylation domain-containing protein
MRLRTRWRIGDSRGFTLLELMIAMAIIGILAAVSMSLLSNMTARARLARAQNDVRVIATAVVVYSSHMGFLPTELTDLTTPAVNVAGISAGPFLQAVPSRPGPGYGPFTYIAAANGTFTVSITGDGTTISAP